jgi:GTPase
MKWRLGEGNGEAIYEIGVHDSGALLVNTSLLSSFRSARVLLSLLSLRRV